MSNFKIGDKVNFVLGTSLFTGTITKFYKNPYNRDECSVKTEVKTYSHILLHRVSKIEDSSALDEKDQQITDLQHRLDVIEKALELACEEIDSEYMYGIYCTEYPQYFKEQAEKELKGEGDE